MEGDLSQNPIQSSRGALTEFVADALVLQQRRVLERVPTVEDLGVCGERGDAPECQHHLVRQQGGGPLAEPCDDGAVATVLWIAEHQDPLIVAIFACRDTENDDGC